MAVAKSSDRFVTAGRETHERKFNGSALPEVRESLSPSATNGTLFLPTGIRDACADSLGTRQFVEIVDQIEDCNSVVNSSRDGLRGWT
jgi:hypothetical protein